MKLIINRSVSLYENDYENRGSEDIDEDNGESDAPPYSHLPINNLV